MRQPNALMWEHVWIHCNTHNLDAFLDFALTSSETKINNFLKDLWTKLTLFEQATIIWTKDNQTLELSV